MLNRFAVTLQFIMGERNNFKIWKKLSHEEIKTRVFGALDGNVDFREQFIIGIPASYLDDKVFNQEDAFLDNAPYISTLIQNPNHIGCHTLGTSESFFAGTQQIERELMELCAVDILNAKEKSTDGYVASGGTEANIQAIWIYRNLFESDFGANRSEIGILCSEDSHYSMDKAANLLGLAIYKVKVNDDDRELTGDSIRQTIVKAQENGIKYFAVVSNMMTTMYGSVDKVELYIEELKRAGVKFKLHIDGAYGGFYFPFTANKAKLSFENPDITSFTLDAHKMAQAPYGTGLFIIRKNHIEYANTKAGYVEGDDFTLIGSRSGANAIAVWMILMKNGPFGWQEKVFILQRRTAWLCEQFDELDIQYYNHPMSNIITIRSEHIPQDVAREFGLVPDNHESPKWFKIVVMDHVTIDKLIPLIQRLRS